MIDLHTNQEINTPNGLGIAEGLIYENGGRYLVVRHQIKKMTSQDHGHSLTPTAKISGLWRYELETITALNQNN